MKKTILILLSLFTLGDVVRAMRKYQIGDIVKVRVKRGLFEPSQIQEILSFVEEIGQQAA